MMGVLLVRRWMLLPWTGETIDLMKNRDSSRHPGPWRVMQVDSEFAGLLVAAGFVAMGFVSMPIATWFLLGAIVFGLGVAVILRLVRR